MKLVFALSLFLLVAALFSVSCTKSQPGTAASAPSASIAGAATGVFEHRVFDELLAAYVKKEGWVDYDGLKSQRAKLDHYLSSLATAAPPTMSNDAEQLAFWINAYNAFTLADVLDDVYGKARSVRDVKGFFDQKKHPIAGEELTLDQIEKKGRELNDPRIHFAVNCASMSCPKLQPRVYTGASLDAQLNQVAADFLGDAGRGMNYMADKNVVYLSPIFKWYAADFTNANSVVARLKAEASGAELLEIAKRYVPGEVSQFLTDKKPKVEYLEYDWTLNSKENNP